MAKTLTMSAPGVEIGGKDVEFEVHGEEGKVGSALVSKGGIEWRGRNARVGRHLSWEQFGALMEEHGKKVS